MKTPRLHRGKPSVMLSVATAVLCVASTSSQEPEKAAVEKSPETLPVPAPEPVEPANPAPAPAPAPGDLETPVQPVDPSINVLPQGGTDPGSMIPVPDMIVPPMPSGPPKKSQVITLSEDYKPIPLTGITMVKDERKKIGDTFRPAVVPGPGITFVGGLADPPAKAELERKLTAQFLGKPLTFGGLEEVMQTVQNHYVTNGRQLTHVFVPAQLMTDKVTIAVLEGKVTKLTAENSVPPDRGWWSKWYSQPYNLDKLAKQVKKKVGSDQTIEPEKMTEILADLNRSPWARLNRPIQHPFRKVNAKYSPVDDLIGETAVTLEVEQSRPLRFFLGYDNTLTDLLGDDRFFGGLVWYDAFGMNWDHQLALQVFSGADTDSLVGGALSYIMPWQSVHQTTELYAAYVDTTADITIGGLPSSVSGTSFLLGARHFFELPPLVGGGKIIHPDKLHEDTNPWWTLSKGDRQEFGVFHEIGIGVDFKSTDNNLEFGGSTISKDTADIFQFALEYNLRQTDSYGETNLTWKNYYSPGDLVGNNSDSDFRNLRALSQAQYYYTKVELDRENDLPWGMLARARLVGQYATENLLQSEQLGFGGHDTVRGYQERIFRGDSGWLFSAELYSPPMHPLSAFVPSWGLKDELRFLVFTDWGSGSAKREVVSDPFDDKQTLGSVGVGLRYDVSDNLRLRVDWGFQLEKLPSPPYPTDSGDNQIHVGVVWTF